MKFKKIWLTSLPLLFTSFVVGCASPSQIKSKQNYVRNYNQANQYADGIFPIFENRKYQNDIEKALFAPLLKYNSFDNLIVDKVNNIITQPSKSRLSFYLASAIKLHFADNTSLTYTNDNFTNNTDLNNNYITNLFSSDITSINHPDFWNNLKKAQQITFELKNDLYYSKYNGDLSNNKFQAQDLISNLSPQIMKDFEKQYGVQISAKNNLLIIKSSKNLADSFIKFELMANMIFNPQPINLKAKNNYKDKLYLSKYLPYQNQINLIRLIKNKFSPDKSFNIALNTIDQITLKYNPTPLDIETFRIQQLRSFRQNLISEVPFNIFNNIQKDDILGRSRQYGLREIFQSNNLQINQRFYFANSFDKQKPNQFNDAFKEFYFQNSQASYLFKYYLSRIYSLFAKALYLDNQYYWNSLSLPLMKLNNNKSEHSNIKTLSDAYSEINIQDIYLYSQNTNKKVNYFDLKNSYFTKKNILDFQKQLPSIVFEEIKKELNFIIDKYLNNSQKILQFNVPILDSDSEKEIQLFEYYVNLLNSISPKMRVKVQKTSLKELQENNYFISFQIFEYPNNTIESYFKLIWNNHLTRTYLNNQFAFNNYPILKSIDFNLEKAVKLIQNQNLKAQINLINELNNLIVLPFDTKNIDNSKNLNKVLVQNYYQFPLSSDGIVNFEDIRI
ncbi:Uncharacterised protein [Mycoplasmopsis citelli]|uniref:Lipoprotein n=1 Tax=Mycoplasmopsis citelli TaxID=171281 RepID=A0A449B2Z1_9BACT|nr:hypothetical protein [Mycoplasmopsis citelli]VEU74904.1 Uncharacterised protein [Mycoplasmopsis citelli]